MKKNHLNRKMQKRPPKQKYRRPCSAFHAGWIWVPASPDVFRAFTSVTHWGNIMCLFIFHNISVLACPLHFLPSLQEVGLTTGSSMCLAGCRCCCGARTHTYTHTQIQLSTLTGPLSEVSLSSASSVEAHAATSSPRTIRSHWDRFSLQTQSQLWFTSGVRTHARTQL